MCDKKAPFKKFIWFSFDCYYPCGGLADIEDSYDTMEEFHATYKAEACHADWNYVLDRDTWEQVWPAIDTSSQVQCSN